MRLDARALSSKESVWASFGLRYCDSNERMSCVESNQFGLFFLWLRIEVSRPKTNCWAREFPCRSKQTEWFVCKKMKAQGLQGEKRKVVLKKEEKKEMHNTSCERRDDREVDEGKTCPALLKGT